MKRARVALPALLAAASVLTVLLVRRNGASDAVLTASGTVEATEADLAFAVPGRIAWLGPREGDRVERSTALARLDTRELEAARAAARADLHTAEAVLAEMVAGSRPEEVARARRAAEAAAERAEDATRDERRASRLFEGGAVSRETLDKARTALEVARAERDRADDALALAMEGPRAEAIRAQRARVERARAELDRAEARVADASIEAPFPGVVTVRHREPGEVVAAGTPVLTVLNPDDRWVRIYVREDRIGRVRLGTAARIVSDSYPARTVEGTVTFIGSEAEFTPRNVQTPDERTRLVYAVKVRVTGDPDFTLKPGIPADVTLPGG